MSRRHAGPDPPARLNQVTYCPRLYYLQYVDAVMPTNEHVEGGLFDHRRVDEPDLGQQDAQGGRRQPQPRRPSLVRNARHQRHSRRDRGKGRRVYPVETKHGSAPHDDDGRATTWDNDAVQLCGQALLMEEAFGARWSAASSSTPVSRERVAVPFTDELRAKTLAAIDQCRQLSTQDAPPDPLPAELRHRCFGCSLAPVCLPEETLYQIGLPAAAERRPRRRPA